MQRRLLAAPDKFRGTATATQVVAAIERAAKSFDWAVDGAPMADGGEGTLDVLGGRVREAVVTGPLGTEVTAAWALKGDIAVVEMALASGLVRAGGAEGNDPLGATTAGTGDLIVAAAKAGAKEILIGAGGSATTDGGLGCVRVLQRNWRFLRTVQLTVLTDVQTKFVDAASVFGPQKGATSAQVELLRRRLDTLASDYEAELGVSVREIAGSGAAGGLAGGLVALGADIASGFDHLAEVVDLETRVSAADVVMTGEGKVDQQSLHGKVVGGVIDLAVAAGVPVIVIAGVVEEGVDLGEARVISLTDRFGEDRALGDTVACIEEAVAIGLPAPPK